MGASRNADTDTAGVAAERMRLREIGELAPVLVASGLTYLLQAALAVGASAGQLAVQALLARHQMQMEKRTPRRRR